MRHLLQIAIRNILQKTVLLVLLMLTGCANSNKGFLYATTPSFIAKEPDIAFNDRMEATPFFWAGKPYMMISARLLNRIEVYDETNALISILNTPIQFASALVSNDYLYVFGSVGSFTPGESEMLMIKTDNLINWSEPIVIAPKRPGMQYFNTSATTLPDGSFVLAYETCEPNTKCFSARFLKSTDLEHWEPTGGLFSATQYAACPTIRYVDGYYYVIYLRDIGHFATFVARSKDLVTWEASDRALLSALGTYGEENNASDVDMIEIGGTVVFNYAIGDQLTYSHIKKATFNGTLEELFLNFF